MIEINLLPGKKKKAAGGGAGFKLALPDFRGLLASIKNPWLLAASAASLIVVGGGLLWFITQSTRLRVAQNRRIEVQAEKRRFDAVIAQKRQSERIRDSLVAEINVIRGIDADRYIWPHVLDQITKALPPYTWLTGISAAGGGNVAPGAPGSLPVGPGTTDSTGRPQVRIWITGSTVDIQAFTTFLRQLAASPWLTDVMPATTSTIIEADRPVTAFNVAVRFRVADSRRKVEEYSALLAVMRRLVPEKNEVPALIDDISTKAKVRGVTIGRIEPQPVEAGPPFDTYRYRLEIIGHYDQLGEFLSDIASLPRIIVPQDVILKAAAQQAQKLLGDTLGALLEAQFGIRTFVKAAAPAAAPAKKGAGGAR